MARLLVPLTRLYCQDGIAGHLATLLPRLRERGWHITTVVGTYDCPANTQPVLDAIHQGCDQFEVDSQLVGRKGGRAGAVWGQMRALRKWVRLTCPDVIHLHGRALGPIAWMVGSSAGRVYTRQLALSPANRVDLRPPTLPRWPRIWCDRAIGISLKTCAELRVGDGMPAAMVRYVPHGIDTTRFRPPTESERRASRAQLGVDDDDTFICVQLGRVVPMKRPETLAGAVSRLRRGGRRVIAVYAGHAEAESERALRQLAGEDGADWLRILGHADARGVLWAADAKVLASEREGFPSAVVEAMACGVVPLRTPTDGAEDQIDHGVNGFIFNLGDEVQLADQIAALIDGPALRRQMGAAAVIKSRQFEAGTMTDKIVSVYDELHAGHPPDPRCACPF